MNKILIQINDSKAKPIITFLHHEYKNIEPRNNPNVIIWSHWRKNWINWMFAEYGIIVNDSETGIQSFTISKENLITILLKIPNQS